MKTKKLMTKGEETEYGFGGGQPINDINAFDFLLHDKIGENEILQRKFIFQWLSHANTNFETIDSLQIEPMQHAHKFGFCIGKRIKKYIYSYSCL